MHQCGTRLPPRNGEQAPGSEGSPSVQQTARLHGRAEPRVCAGSACINACVWGGVGGISGPRMAAALRPCDGSFTARLINHVKLLHNEANGHWLFVLSSLQTGRKKQDNKMIKLPVRNDLLIWLIDRFQGDIYNKTVKWLWTPSVL